MIDDHLKTTYKSAALSRAEVIMDAKEAELRGLLRLPNIPEGQNTWEAYAWVKGERIALHELGLEHILLVLRKPGRPAIGCELGWIDDGKFAYDGLSHFEMAGGGVIVVRFLIWNDELYIALITQTRALVGGEVETVPRGYAEIGKSAAEQAKTEDQEELGGELSQSVSDKTEDGEQSEEEQSEDEIDKWEMFQLDGVPSSTNTSLSNTSRPRPDGTPAGSIFFACEIDPDCVEPDENDRPRFKDGAVNPTDPKENITSWRLAPWWEAVQLHDSCPAVAVARLLAHLNKSGRFEPFFQGGGGNLL